MPAAGAIAVLLFPLLVTIAGALDVMTRRIPNLLVVTTACAFFPLAWAVGMPPWMLAENCATALILLGLGFLLFSFGFFGGGDAKLLAAIGLWLGFPPSVVFVGFSAIAGGILAAAIGGLFLLQLESTSRGARIEALFSGLAPNVPYGFALAVGAILAVPFSWLSPPVAGG